MRKVEHIIWLKSYLAKEHKAAPKRQWRWAAYSSGWDAKEIREVFRKDATEDSADIWRALSEHATSGRWPKLSGRAAHFLRERLVEAMAVCDAWLQENHPAGALPPATQPPDSEALFRQVVIEHWNSKGVEQWLDEHEADFQEYEWDPEAPDPDYP